MDPNVIRLYSSSPPPMDEAGEEEEEEDEFGEFGSFDGGGVSSSVSFSELDTPITFNQSKALEDSPPDLPIKPAQSVSEKIRWVNEQEIEIESPQSLCVESALELSESDVCASEENTSRKSTETLTNGVMSSESSDVQQSRSHQLDRHGLSNGYSKTFQHSEIFRAVAPSPDRCLEVAEELDQSFDKPRETESASEACKSSTEIESEEEQRENDQPLSDDVHFEVCSSFLDTSTASVASTTDVSLVSNEQSSGSPEEIASLSTNAEEDADTPTHGKTSVDSRDAIQGFADFSQTESLTQEEFADYVTAMSRCSTDEDDEDTDTLKDFTAYDELEEDAEKFAGGEETLCCELPPSDSFADFTSAPFDGNAMGEEDNWAAFGQHNASEEESWAAFGESPNVWEEQDVEKSAASSCDDLQSNVETTGSKIQHLFRTCFPSHDLSEVSDVTEVFTVREVLQRKVPEEGRNANSCFIQGNALDVWLHLQDINCTHGLKFKWAGSHTNRILLNSLGIRNILFTGETKQAVIVPMFAAGLGMLEPTKEPPKSPAALALFPPGSLESERILCTQVAPSLTTSLDDGEISELNLDFFGPLDECSSDSESDTPPAGVDPELYELTTAKMENSTGRSIADAFTKLMASVEKTTTTRKQEGEEKISEEAARVISILPDLSFMKARVLMFPSILTPAANHVTELGTSQSH